MRIMWSIDTTLTLKFWNSCYFIYKGGISLAFETTRNCRSTAQISQPSQCLANNNSSDNYLKRAQVQQEQYCPLGRILEACGYFFLTH